MQNSSKLLFCIEVLLNQWSFSRIDASMHRCIDASLTLTVNVNVNVDVDYKVNVNVNR